MQKKIINKAVVASGHARVTAAACEILRAGGNAFDAAVAAGFAAAVAEPALTSLGGGGFLLARTAEGQELLFDFFVDTPGRGQSTSDLEPHFIPVTINFPNSEQVFNVGLGSVAVPGNLCGYLYVHQRLGRLALAEVLAPAIELAREGLVLSEAQAYFLKLLYPILTLMPAGKALFEPAGRYLVVGDRFANPELASFLETLTEGGDREFYKGVLARSIAEDMAGGGGLLSASDLAAYAVIEREPLAVDYRGFRLLSNPPPSFGGSLIALSLRLLEACDVDRFKFGSAQHLAMLVAVMEEVDRLRDGGLHDSVTLVGAAAAESHARVRRASGGTTHVSVCDTQGNVASMTTSNGEGSGYIVPGTGIMLNNMLGEDDLHPDGFHASPPGMRVASMMSPSVLLHDGKVAMVAGSGGSKRIRTALLQVISNVVDFGMNVAGAVDALRLHWDGKCVQIEPGFPAASVTALQRRWPVNRWGVRDIYFGGVHAVSPHGAGAGDARRGGSACVLDEPVD